MSDDLKAAVATLEHFIQWKPEQRSGQDVIIAVRRVLDALREAQVVNKRLHKNIDINLELLEKTEAKLTAEESAHEATRRAGLQTVATLEAQLAELQRENERLHKNIDINLELLEKAEAALAAERAQRERMEKAGERLIAWTQAGKSRGATGHDWADRSDRDRDIAAFREALRPESSTPSGNEWRGWEAKGKP